MRKNIFAGLLLFFCLFLGMSDQTAQAAKKSTVKAAFKKGVLTISGKGAMPENFKVKNKSKVKRVVIKKGVTTVSDYAFDNFKNLKSVKIPSTVKRIGWCSFRGTSLKKATVPKSVKSIGQCAFDTLKKMNQLTLPGEFSFRLQRGDDAISSIADNVETVVFSTRLKLSHAELFLTNNFVIYQNDPKYKSIRGVIYSRDGKSIVRVPFGRRNLEIEDGCEEFCLSSVLYSKLNFEMETEAGCKLAKLVIPASVKRVDPYKYETSYYNQDKVVSEIDLKTKQLDGMSLSLLSVYLEIKPETLMNLLPEQITFRNEMYLSHDGVLIAYTGKAKEVVVPAGVKKIGMSVFQDNKYIDKAVLPEGLDEIGEYAFCRRDLYPEWNGKLQIQLPSTLKKIGDYALGWNNIERINLPSSLQFIGKYALAGNNFSNIVLPHTLKEISEGMFFENSKNFTCILIPDSVQRIGSCAFQSCTCLREISLGKSVKEIGAYAFDNTALKEVTIPASVTKIADHAWSDSSYRKKSGHYILEGSSKGIDDQAFSSTDDILTYTKSPSERKTMLQVMSFDTKKKKAVVKIRWNKVTGVSGYQFVLASNESFSKDKKTIILKKTQNSFKGTIQWKNKKSKGFYGKIRPFTNVGGKRIYGRWSKDTMLFS